MAEKFTEQHFQDFIVKLASRMAQGNFNILVSNDKDQKFKAKVEGYDKEYMTVKVRFESDSLTIPQYVPEEKKGFGYGTGDDDDVVYVIKQVPVKTMHVTYTSTILED